MRLSIITVLATLSSLAVAQDILGSLPKCGQDCFGNNFAGCEQFDYACICGNKDLIAELSCCVSTNCSDNDENTIITLASGLCKAYGVDVPTKASCAASASSTAASSASGSASSSGGSSITSAPATTSASESETAAAQSSTRSPGAAGPVATANAGLGLAVGMAGLLVAL